MAFFSLSAIGWAGGSAGQPGSFLRQPVGARALSLGGAYSALSDDVSSIYWNPAGLTLMDKPEVTATHILLFEDTTYDFIAGGLPPRNWGSLGFGYVRQASSGFEKRSVPLDTPTNFSIVDSALLAGWGYTVPNQYTWNVPVRAGATLKSVQEGIDTVSASGWGADAGVTVEPYSQLRLAAVFQNAIQPKLAYVSSSIPYARVFRFGGAYNYKVDASLDLIPVMELSKVDQDSLAVAGGVELVYRKLGAMRVGMNQDGLSTGLGFRWGNARVDYGVAFNDLGLTHQMSLSLKFGQTKEELEEFIRQGIQRFTKDEASRLARAYLRQGELSYEEKDYTQALKNMEAAALWDPQDRHIEKRLYEVRADVDHRLTEQILDRTILLAEQQMERGNMLASQGYWMTVLDIDPESQKAKAALKKIERAMDIQQRHQLEELTAKKIQQDVDRAVATAASLMEGGQYRSAIIEVERALKTTSNNSKLKIFLEKARKARETWAAERIELAKKLIDSRENAKAAETLEGVISEHPDNQDASDQLARLKQIMQAPMSPEVRKQLDRQYYSAVDAYLHGKYKDSVDLINQILAKDPLNENARKLKDKVEAASKIAP